MERLIVGISVLALCASAQSIQTDGSQPDELRAKVKAELNQAVTVTLSGAVMGTPVQGAPYTALETNQTTQTLGDGTVIHNQTQATVYRDGLGRMRRETGALISITDPVGQVRYELDSESKTARKLPLGLRTASVTAPSVAIEKGSYGVMTYSTDSSTAYAFTYTGNAGGVGGDHVMVMKKKGEAKGEKESLGTQTMEGVVADGTRVTNTIETGAIGNDRPIHVVSERWYSPELQTMVMTKHSDPRSGDEVFSVTNIRRGEPDPSLFQVPADYKIVERK
jgi:hypothetical protein